MIPIPRVVRTALLLATAMAWILADLAVGLPPAADHWAFVPPRRPRLPERGVRPPAREAIDVLLGARLDAAGLAPAPETDRATFIRRVTLDLIGLPPTPQEVARFVEDPVPEACDRLVDRLLASPHYGERWARQWLDMAHHADSDGYLTDQLRPSAWRYRHWLVEALNRDPSFDRFTLETIAGDLLPGATLDQRLATGFFRGTLSNREGGADLHEFRVARVVDRTNTTGAVWLGLTFGCARCHDHKYDPINQREFFGIYAFFNGMDEINVDAPLPEDREPYLEALAVYRTQRVALLEPVEAEVVRLQMAWEKKLLEAAANPGRDHQWDRAWEVLGLVWGGGLGEGQLEGQRIVKTDPARRTIAQRERLRDYFFRRGSGAQRIDSKRAAELKLGELGGKLASMRPAVVRAPTIEEHLRERVTRVHTRGDFRQPGEIVTRATPEFMNPLPAAERSRVGLARWLCAADNPLTARVVVNRLWQSFFGRGLVATPDDFGTRGAPPSHPDLLDWLAVEFRESGWAVKRMHRQIVLSATYRQSSRMRPELVERDPANILLARQSRLRLDAELIRDCALAASGLLEPTIGGPTVRPPQPESVSSEGYENGWKTSEKADRYRRGIYTFIQRTTPFAQSIIFDAPDPSRTCTHRERSNTPLQALTLLNDEVFVEAAAALARRIRGEAPGGVGEAIDHGFLLCFARLPRTVERDRLLGYYRAQVGVLGEKRAWVALASVLINLDEFITRE